jgi:hypothetical protein
MKDLKLNPYEFLVRVAQKKIVQHSEWNVVFFLKYDICALFEFTITWYFSIYKLI